MKKNILNTLLGILIGGAFLYFTLANKPLEDILNSILQAKSVWVIASALILLIVFYLRAKRWHILLENDGHKASFGQVFHAILMAYFVNSFTPRIGEIVRCTSLYNSSEIPVSKSLGTVVSERVYDMLILFLGLIVLVFIELDRLGGLLADMYQNISSWLSFTNIMIIVVLILGMLVLMLWYLRRENALSKKIKSFISELIQTVIKSFKIKKYRQFLLLTILIWAALVLMNYFFLLALPETDSFSMYFAYVVLFIGGIGWALPSPGGIGTTHFFILQIFILFGLNETSGVSFGILSNGLTFLFTILYGVIALVIHFLMNQKLPRQKDVPKEHA